MLFICSACFVLCQLQKTHFRVFSPSPCLLLASLCGVRGKRECGFNQRAGQPPPLMIHSTSTETKERRASGREVGERGDFSCGSRKSHVNMTADSPRRQIHPAATCKDGRRSTYYTEGGEWQRGREIKKGWVSQWERKHQANGADGRKEQTKASDSHHKHGNPEIWPHMSACKQSLLTHT